MKPRHQHARLITTAIVSMMCLALPAHATFVNFETGQVRPLALTVGAQRLLAVNTPDARLSIFAVTDDGLQLQDEVPVGLEPVAIATRRAADGTDEAWVVNHLSDDITIVRIPDSGPAYVSNILHVGDEPRDILFAGHDTERAFITTAHRGQYRPGDPQLTTPGIPRADVWVFDAANPGPANGGQALTIVELFGDTPRALARTPDGRTVYAAVFASGNRTTALPPWIVRDHGGLPPPPSDSPYARKPFPAVGLIVQAGDDGRFLDELGRDWSPQVPFTLPDYDVFAIDADAPHPTGTGIPIAHVGTTLFNMAINPISGALYVTNLEARNQIRFEPNLRSHFVDNRITVVRDGATLPVDLNPHIDRSRPPGEPAVLEQSLALPTALACSDDGRALFVAAFGSRTVARLDTTALEAGHIAGPHIAVGAGPNGLVLDTARDRLYAMNQLDHTITVVGGAHSAAPQSIATVSVGYDPTPEKIRTGRSFLYDARNTSAFGDSACASCHIFGDTDHLAWDLGDPYGRKVPNWNKQVSDSLHHVDHFEPFHPMKGPMVTQSLRGLAHAGPMHWRGDRTGALRGRPMDERAAFMQFNPTFVKLQGRRRPLPKKDMRAFTEFALTLRYPPNPIAPFQGVLGPTNILSPSAEQGRQAFNGEVQGSLIGGDCRSCHVPTFNELTSPMDIRTSKLGRNTIPLVPEPQEFKAPHIRNLYQKVGMFGVAANPIGVPANAVGDQVRGFGFIHDGSLPTLTAFLFATHYPFDTDQARDNMVQFLLEAPTGFDQHVGTQALFEPGSSGPSPRMNPDWCSAIVHTMIGGVRRGFTFTTNSQLVSDRRNDPPIAWEDLLKIAERPVYSTCVPVGTAAQYALDRDENGVLDGDEPPSGVQ